MKTGYIRFSETNNIEIKFVNGTIWLTANEIADFFGVSISIVNKNMKEIFKDNLLRELEVVKEYRYTCPKHGECIRVYYNLEVIICLNFRIQSFYAKIFREWVFCSLCRSNQSSNIFIDCGLIIGEYSLFSLN